MIASARLSPVVTLWDINTKQTHHLTIGEAHTRVIGIDIEGKQMVAANNDGLFKVVHSSYEYSSDGLEEG